MTKAQLLSLVNGYLAPNQPITANGQHKPSMEKVIDEMYDPQSRGDVLAGVDDVLALDSGDLVLIIRGDGAKLAPKDLFAGGAITPQWRGAANIGGGLYPTNGSGTAGAVVAGDMWSVTVSGSLDLGTGAEVVPVKSILVALTNAPGQTAANWRVI